MAHFEDLARQRRDALAGVPPVIQQPQMGPFELAARQRRGEPVAEPTIEQPTFASEAQAVASQIPQGIANLAGLPAEVISGIQGFAVEQFPALQEFNRKIGLDPLANPVETLTAIASGGQAVVPGISEVAGAEPIAEAIRETGIPVGEEPQTTAGKIIGTGVEFAAESIIPVGALLTKGKALAASASPIAKRIGQELISNPKRFATQEGLASLFAGLGSETAQQLFPESEFAPFIGGLVGAVTPGGVSAVVRRGEIPEAAADIIAAGERADVPVTTTDVIPPTTGIGQLAQATGEKIPLVGTARQQAVKQAKRVTAIENVVTEFDVGLDTPLEATIIQSLGDKQTANMTKAIGIRNKAIATLNPLGDVSMDAAQASIGQEIAKEGRLGTRANASLINLLRDTGDALQGNFELIKDVRTRVIQDIKKLQRGEHEVLSSQDEAVLQRVKSAIDRDMNSFAKTNDRQAAAQWKQSNRLFFDEFTKFKNSELKKLLAKGDLTPEVVAPILKGGKVSQLNRLNNNLTPEGQAAARAAIVRDVMTRAGVFTGDINPDRVATAFNRPEVQKAIKVFFKGEDRKQLQGFINLLGATRRAQQAAVTTPTGQQLIPGLFGAALVTEPLTTFLTATTVGSIARAYESKPVRNFLLRASDAKGRELDQFAIRFAPIINAAIGAENAITE